MTAPDLQEPQLVEIAPAPDGGTPYEIDAYRINGVLGSLHRARHRLAIYDDVAERRINEINAEITRNRQPLSDAVAELEAMVETVAGFLYQADPKHPSLVVPNGRVGSEAAGVEWSWPDEGSEDYEALVRWLKVHHPEAVAFPMPSPLPPPRPDKAKAKEVLKPFALADEKGPQKPAHPDGLVVADGGEIVPGLRVRSKPRRVVVDLTPVEDES